MIAEMQSDSPISSSYLCQIHNFAITLEQLSNLLLYRHDSWTWSSREDLLNKIGNQFITEAEMHNLIAAVFLKCAWSVSLKYFRSLLVIKTFPSLLAVCILLSYLSLIFFASFLLLCNLLLMSWMYCSNGYFFDLFATINRYFESVLEEGMLENNVECILQQ